MTRLGDVCEKIGSGATPRGGKEAYKDAGIPIIRSQNIHDWVFQPDGLAFLDDEQAESLSNVEVRSNDVLLNITGDSVARACIVPSERIPARVNQHVAIVRAGKEINPTYLLASLQSKKTTLLSLASSGATRNALTKRMIENLDIDLPSREMQDSIAQVLDSIQYKITLNNRLNDYLFELVSSVFAHRFSDNVNTTELKNVLSISTKALKPQEHADEIWEHYSIPAFDEKHRPIFEPASGIKSNKYQIDSECILISKLNPSTKRIWMPCCSSNNAVCSTEFIVYRPYLKEYKSFYYAAIDSPRFTDYLLEHVSGSTGSRQRAQPKDTLNYLMPNPDNEEIKDFCTFADPIYRHIQINEQQTAKLELLRETLLPKLMSGAIDVSKVDLTQLTNNHLSGCGSFCSVCCPSGLASEFHEWFRERFFFGYGHLCKADLGWEDLP